MMTITPHTPLRILLLLALLPGLWAGAASAAGTGRELAWFEERVDHALDLLAAQDETGARRAQTDESAATAGWKLLGSAAIGAADEPVDENQSRSYNFISGRLGLRYPLLGSWLREHEQIDDAAALARLAAADEQRVRRTLLRAIRDSYIDFWAAQRLQELNVAFLSGEPGVKQILDLRRDRDLLLEADRLEFLSMYAAARRNQARYLLEEQEALARLGGLTDVSISGFEPGFPELAPLCSDVLHLSGQLRVHPDLEALQIRLEQAQEKTDRGLAYHVESGVNLVQTYVQESPGGSGATTMAAVDFQFPLGIFQARDATRSRRSFELRALQRQLEERHRQLMEKAENLHFAVQYQQRNIRFAAERLASTEETVRTAFLRAGLLPGDNLERLQQGLYAYYLAAVDLIEAQRSCLKLKSELLELAPAEERKPCDHYAPAAEDATEPRQVILSSTFASLLESDSREHLAAAAQRLFGRNGLPAATPEKESVSATNLGAYLWRAELLPVWRASALDTAAWAAELKRRTPFDHLLISFTGAQIERLRSEPRIRERLLALLGDLRSAGIRPNLLLGEPTWILPAHRLELLSLVRQLAGLPFAGLHLDLEPNQLAATGLSDSVLLQELAATTAATAAASPWPVSLSLHPRYLEAQADGRPFAALLEKIAPEYVALMIYLGDPQKTAARAMPLLAGRPGLEFRIAQSVEPPGVLPSALSYADRSREELMKELARLEEALAGAPNFTGALIQNFSYFQGMKE